MLEHYVAKSSVRCMLPLQCMKYKGHPINKLPDSVIALIFKM